MSFRELHMIDVMELLRRWKAGQSDREIARAGVGDRKTVARYLAAAQRCGLAAGDALTEETVRAVVHAVQDRPKPPPSEAWKTLEGQRARIEQWLHAPRPLRLVRVHELLGREGIVVGYTTLRRFAQVELGFHAPRSTVLVEDAAPGDEAQIDFGQMGYVELDEGRRRLWALIVTLCVSRYMFVWPTFTQTLVDVCAALDAAWAFFDGVVRRIVPDNPTTMIVRADAKSPTLHRSFAEYTQARGVFVDPARVAHPQDKGRVENQVPYVRERWFDGETFPRALDEIRAHAAHWCREVAGARVHGTTRRVPREHYEQDERAHMQPAPDAPFDVPRWTTAKVHADHHIQVERALYSAPTTLLHKEVEVRVDRATVRIFYRHELIKIHPRRAPGKRSTDPSHYPTGKADYAMRSVDGVKARAAQAGARIGEFAERLLDGPLPWVKMRQAYGLLRLCDRYGVDRVESLCARALSFDVIDVTRIERMLKTAQQTEHDAETHGKLVALPSRFARDPASFATRDRSRNDGGAS